MGYELLRNFIISACSDDYVASVNATFDMVHNPLIDPYVDRIRQGENAGAVVREFIKEHVDGTRSWTLKVNNESYTVRIKSRFVGHVAHPLEWVTSKTDPDIVSVSKNILNCLANLDDVLRNGRPTRYIPDDGHNPKHAGFKWVYVSDEIEGEASGRVLVQISVPPAERLNNSKFPTSPLVYHIVTKGKQYPKFGENVDRYERNKALEGEVTITLNG